MNRKITRFRREKGTQWVDVPKNRIVAVTDTGTGLSRAETISLWAQRASVVANDTGTSWNGYSGII